MGVPLEVTPRGMVPRGGADGNTFAVGVHTWEPPHTFRSRTSRSPSFR